MEIDGGIGIRTDAVLQKVLKNHWIVGEIIYINYHLHPKRS